jgi:Pvc16 N-terminal domain
MTNSLGIGAVTAALRNLLQADVDVGGTLVTTHPPDKARPETDAANPNRVNIFCYRTSINGALSNMELPGQVRPGETGQPPLAVNLHYVVTAINAGDDEVLSNRMLGRAMQVFHDRPVLARADLEAALALSDLDQQIERVRITHEPLSIDDISRLWSAFQTEYRFSAYYHVSVVLIEGTRPTRTPPPVLARGQDDSGVDAQPDLAPPPPSAPTLRSVAAPAEEPAAVLGELLTATGHRLDGDPVRARLSHSRLEASLTVDAEPGFTATTVGVRLPDQPAQLPAGVWTLALLVTVGGVEHVTNELPFAIAPKLESVTPPGPIPPGSLTLTVAPRPQVWLEQRAALLFGSREVLPAPRTDKAMPLRFDVGPVTTGEYLLRLRVGGIDSRSIDHSTVPPTFDPSQKVTVS